MLGNRSFNLFKHTSPSKHFKKSKRHCQALVGKGGSKATTLKKKGNSAPHCHQKQNEAQFPVQNNSKPKGGVLYEWQNHDRWGFSIRRVPPPLVFVLFRALIRGRFGSWRGRRSFFVVFLEAVISGGDSSRVWEGRRPKPTKLPKTGYIESYRRQKQNRLHFGVQNLPKPKGGVL